MSPQILRKDTGRFRALLDELLIDQGILIRGRFDLLCFPDYLFFRNHPHKLYREFSGFPRYSIFSRKFTDKYYKEYSCNDDFSLNSLYILDGNTALTNAQFFFPLTRCFNFSVTGTNLDFTELGKIRYTTLPEARFSSFQPYSIILDNLNDNNGLHDGTSLTLPRNYDLKLCDLELKMGTIIIGSVNEIADFFPQHFDILRLNLGDLIEYQQKFFPENIDHIKKRDLVLEELKTFVTMFNIPLVLVSLYKYTKFFVPNSIKGSKLYLSIELLKEKLNYKEWILFHNIKRRRWEPEPLGKLEELIDTQGYIALF